MAKPDKQGLGERVKKRREHLNLSQVWLARAVGMKQQGIVNIEKGLVERPRKLLELAAALHTSQEWLLYAQGPESVTKIDPIEELVSLARTVNPEQLGAVIQFLRTLGESDEEVA